MTLRLICKKYNGTSPGKISITYFYPEERSNKHFIETRFVLYAKSLVPDSYKSYININDV